MKITTQKQPFAVMLAVLLAALAAFVTTGQAQVTFTSITNGLVDYYPLQGTTPGSTNATPDLIGRRDFTMINMTATNFIADTHGGIDGPKVIDLAQSGGATILLYFSKGQNPLSGTFDTLPFINQRNATMNFWIKGNPTNANVGGEVREWAECAQDGQSSPFLSMSSKNSGVDSFGHFFLRDDTTTTDPNGVSTMQMPDGSYELPLMNAGGGNFWTQQGNYTADPVVDGNWHMLTMEIDSNANVYFYVDGNLDPGQGGNGGTDSYGNPVFLKPLWVTNAYYTTNIYPSAGVSNPPPNGYVKWVVPFLNDPNKGGSTVFGGFDRNASISAGLNEEISDIGYWNRTLSTNEMQYLETNTGSFSALTLNTNLISINGGGLSADLREVGVGGSVQLSWNVTGASSSPGGITINNGVGDFSSSPVGSTLVSLPTNGVYTFTLTAHNGIVADQTASVTVYTLLGVPSNWNLIQRFDKVFQPTTAGIATTNNWVGIDSYYGGVMDRFNVKTVNGNEVLSPSSGYVVDTSAPIGFDPEGSLAYGALGHLTLAPGQSSSLFFRFSLHDPGTFDGNGPDNLGISSALDFAMGLSDYNFGTGPLGYVTNDVGAAEVGAEGTFGPNLEITRYDPSGNYAAEPFDLNAQDYSGVSVTNTYSYIASVNASGLQTNVNYMVWMDVSNADTMAGPNTNTINEPTFTVWLEAQGSSTRTLLFSNYYGTRSYVGNAGNDNPTPYLNKLWFGVANETLNSGGAFIETNNMLLLDDMYMSSGTFNSTIPSLFDLTSIVRSGSGVTINWNSLGSLFQTNTYSVQRTLSLSGTPTWTTLTNGLPSGGNATSFTDTSAGSDNAAYYRITWP
jgi:hypothetical protein